MKKHKVMIIEQDSDLAHELSLRLERLGYGITAIVRNEQEALESAGTAYPDIVVMTIGREGDLEEGTAAAGRLRDTCDLPVIYITSSGEDDTLDRAKVTCPYGFLVSPFEDRELRIALEVAYHRHSADKQIRDSKEDLRKYRVHLEAVVARRTAELKKTNAHLHRLLHFIELTERKLATDALDIDLHEEREAPVSAEEGIITADRDLSVVLINAAATELLGRNGEEVIGGNITDVFRCSDMSMGSRLARSLKAIITSGSPGVTLENVPVTAKDGEIVSFTVYFEPIFDSDNGVVGIVLTFRDAAESRKKEYEALRTKKMESLNLMVRGVAHDFNNILSSVLANVQLVKVEMQEGSHRYELLNSAEDGVLRARELSEQLLTYSNGDTPQAKTTDLAGLISRVGTFSVRGTRSRSIFSLPADLWDVPLDEDLVRLVLNDLFLYIEGSLMEGGTISVSAENVIAGSGTATSLQPVDYIRIQIHAAELVIPQEVLRDLFRHGSSPAFSVDLSFAESVIRKSGGLLEIDSDTGSGTRVVLYLPARHRKPRVREKEKGQIPSPAHLPGKKKILLMDDEEAILSATSEMLKFLGYEVAVAHDGENALDLYRKAGTSGQPFDAVILDITIPGGMGAQETLPGLAAFDPAVKAIITSGYSTNPMIVDYRTFGFVSAIVKPYGFKELGEALDTAFR